MDDGINTSEARGDGLPTAGVPKTNVHYLPTARTMKKATLEEMARQVRDYYTDERIRTRVRQIFAAAGVESGDYLGEVKAVWDFMLSHVRYMRDPPGVEHITGPIALDAQVNEGTAAEDCESMVVYAATLLMAAGHTCEFEIYAMDPSHPDEFTHVALSIQPPTFKKWVTFDLVGASHRDNFGLGDTVWTPDTPIERWTIDGQKRDASIGHIRPSKPAPRRMTPMQSLYMLGFGDVGQMGDVDPAQIAASIAGALGSGVAAAANIYEAATGHATSTLTAAQQQALAYQQQQALLPWYKQDAYALPLYIGGGLLLLKIMRVI